MIQRLNTKFDVSAVIFFSYADDRQTLTQREQQTYRQTHTHTRTHTHAHTHTCTHTHIHSNQTQSMIFGFSGPHNT